MSEWKKWYEVARQELVETHGVDAANNRPQMHGDQETGTALVHKTAHNSRQFSTITPQPDGPHGLPTAPVEPPSRNKHLPSAISLSVTLVGPVSLQG